MPASQHPSLSDPNGKSTKARTHPPGLIEYNWTPDEASSNEGLFYEISQTTQAIAR